MSEQGVGLCNGVFSDLLNVAAVFVAAYLAFRFGIRQQLEIDRVRDAGKRLEAARVIARELGRIVDWHKVLLSKPEYGHGGLVFGLFLPVNSLREYRPALIEILHPDQVKVVEDAYVNFAKYDYMARLADERSSVDEAGQRARALYWDAINDARTRQTITSIQAISRVLEDYVTTSEEGKVGPDHG